MSAATAAIAGGTALAHMAPAVAQPTTKARTFVLVHGAWHGGWCWRAVADRLRAAGHLVFTPTQTGLGERKHLLAKSNTLDVFIDDIVNVIQMEQLDDVILVGHSFGGISISGVADRIPKQLRHLVYLDSLILQNGQTAFSQLPDEVVAARIKAADETSGRLSLPPPPAAAFGLTREVDQKTIAARLTPHPLSTYNSALNLKSPVGNGVPRTYITCTAPMYPALAKTRAWVKEQGWPTLDIATGHDAMVAAPDELTAMLQKLAS